MTGTRERPLLLWDGDCGFCAKSMKRLRRLDRRNWFDDMPNQRCPSPPMDERLGERCRREVVLLTPDGHELGGARAIFMCLAHGGGPVVSTLAAILRTPPFVWLVIPVYRLIANNRSLMSRLFVRSGEPCGLPELESRRESD